MPVLPSFVHPLRRGVAVLATAAVIVVATGAPSAHASVRRTASDTYESDVVVKANVERAKVHKGSLRTSSCVDGYAEKQATAMAAKQQMYHQSLVPILKRCHLKMVGENVAYGFGSGAAVTKAWMASPGHKANLLRTDYRLIGVGAVQDKGGVWYVSQVFGRAA